MSVLLSMLGCAGGCLAVCWLMMMSRKDRHNEGAPGVPASDRAKRTF
jgi:hypothetical protein